MKRVPATALVVQLIAGCTAMGAWVYDDPSFALRTVTMRPAAGAGGGDSLELEFLGCNRNDYDLLGERFRLRLARSGSVVAEGTRDQPIFLGTRDTSSFVVVLPLWAARLGADSAAGPFELSATSVVHTPIGDRDVAFRLRGRVEAGDTGYRWRAENPICRPGLSVLPGRFDRRALGSDEDTLPRRPIPMSTDDPNRPGQPAPGTGPRR